MGASAIHLSKLDRMQQFAEKLCSSHFIPLQKRRDLLCKLLDGTCREHLQMFCPAFTSSIRRSHHVNIPRPFLLADLITATSLDLFFLKVFLNNWTKFTQLHVSLIITTHAAYNL